jgi:hypothetical protein
LGKALSIFNNGKFLSSVYINVTWFPHEFIFDGKFIRNRILISGATAIKLDNTYLYIPTEQCVEVMYDGTVLGISEV